MHDLASPFASSDAGPSVPRKPSPKSLSINPASSSTPATAPFSAPASFASFPEMETLDVIPTRAGRKLCVRHKQMANQNVNEKLQKSLDNLPTAERSAVTHLWSTFSNAPHAKRKLILEGILTMCCFSQLSHLSDSLNQIIRIDPFSLLPREVNLRILGCLDAVTLGRAAQVSRPWKALADDDLIWRRMCGQHIDRKCEKCGWGLPMLERRRLKIELNERSPAVATGVGGHEHGQHHRPSMLVTRDEAMAATVTAKGPGAAAAGLQGAAASLHCDPAGVPIPSPTAFVGAGVKRSAPASPAVAQKKAKVIGSDSEGDGPDRSLTRETRLTRPWKTVYCERLAVERNWRKGRCKTTTLRGHEDGVMCLQYHTALTHPSYPVLITGSYDRTVRVWNLDTGEAVHVLRGHGRAIRALQFDQMLLFTGAMDGTVRMWNWRAGECLRVLEGHTDGVVSLNYNGYLLASGSADSTIQVWNFRTGGKFTLRGHEDWVNSVLLWDGKSSPSDLDPTQMPSFPTQTSRRAASPADVEIEPGKNDDEGRAKPPDIEPGAKLFSASDDGSIKLWDLETRECIRTFEGHKAQVQSLKVIMVDASDLNRGTVKRTARFTTPPSGFQRASQVSLPSPPQAGSAAGPVSSAIDHAPEGYDPNAFRARGANEAVAPRVFVHSPHADGAGPAGTGDVDGDSDRGHAGGKESEGEMKKAMLVTGSLDGTVKLWDVETGMEKATLFGHIEGVWGVDVDTLRIASASHDRTVKVWDRESGTCVHTFTGHRGAVTSLQLSDDMIVSGSDDGDVMVWSFAPHAASSSVNGERC